MSGDGGQVMRGAHVLPHQSQSILRDLHGEQIRRHFGATAHAFRLTADELAERKAGRGPFLPYEYLLHSPGSSAFSWTAFYDREGFAAFLAAYALTIDREPAPGEPFRVILPADDSDWQELSGPFLIGETVTVRGGFEDGLSGVIIANEPDRSRDNPYGADRPYRYRVRYERCPYCGDGACSGSPRTANGADIDRWYAVHTSAHPNPGTVGGLHPVDLERAERS